MRCHGIKILDNDFFLSIVKCIVTALKGMRNIKSGNIIETWTKLKGGDRNLVHTKYVLHKKWIYKCFYRFVSNISTNFRIFCCATAALWIWVLCLICTHRVLVSVSNTKKMLSSFTSVTRTFRARHKIDPINSGIKVVWTWVGNLLQKLTRIWKIRWQIFNSFNWAYNEPQGLISHLVRE